MAPLGSRVRLPPGVTPPFEVFVNGVGQVEGRDYTVSDGALIFDRELVQPRKDTAKSLFRTLFFGRYAPEHVVDVTYQAGGESRVASGLDIEPGQTSE
jgi:hypothetical protein